MNNHTPIKNCKTQQNLRDFIERVFVEEGEDTPLPLCTACEEVVSGGACFVCPQGCEFGLCQACFDAKKLDHPHALERLVLFEEDEEDDGKPAEEKNESGGEEGEKH